MISRWLIIAIGVVCTFPFPVKCADTTLRWYIGSPWIHSPRDSSGVSLIGHVPVISQQMDQPGVFSRFSNPGLQTPQAKDIRGFAIPIVRIQLPLTEESKLYLSYSPMGMIRWSQERVQEEYSLADSSGGNWVRSHGWLTSSSSLDAQWSILCFEYSVGVSNLLDLSLIIERHSATLSGDGVASGNAIVDWRTNGQESGTIEYGGSDYQSNWSANYRGSAWSAGFSTRVGRFLYYGQMGIVIPLKGNFQISQRLPFYLDSISLEATPMNADEWIEEGTRDQVLGRETQDQEFYTSKPISFRIPQIHRIGAIIQPWLHVDYTYRTGHFRSKITSATGSISMDYRRFTEYDINLNHLFLTHIQTNWFLSELGMFWIHKRLEPIVSFTARLPWNPVSWSVQVDALPWVRIFFGVAYAL